ncbi:unnamed protein product [Ostreobium quekettii]|uniref:Iron-sulfur cluster biosynthesis family protein n=1 Tax=Ostreobium quekettii TaxID=121088 RepID=A0A8S1IUG1_9CHLO|nr:unnamed protein product [Ostreobium quekettii]|eukprot:evm.model.scf_1721.3 EVM.evm.TU.scf_1721.3   scf_1721:22232-25991(+)
METHSAVRRLGGSQVPIGGVLHSPLLPIGRKRVRLMRRPWVCKSPIGQCPGELLRTGKEHEWHGIGFCMATVVWGQLLKPEGWRRPKGRKGGLVGASGQPFWRAPLKTIESERKLASPRLPADLRARVSAAVQKLGFRVTVGDVAGQAGVTIEEAEEALKALAADSLGTLEVSAGGEVVYVFEKNFQNSIRAKSISLRLEPALQTASAIAAYTARVTFGATLIASCLIVWAALIAVMSSRSDSSDRNGGSYSRSYYGGGLYFNMFDMIRILQYVFLAQERQEPEDMNFLESIFSVVFGDGDPNRGFSEKRWNAIGQYIQAKGGVVTAEELAPYLDRTNRKAGSGGWEWGEGAEEGYVLPALLRFGGEAEVDSAGNLLYVFPKMQATSAKWKPLETFRGALGQPSASYVLEEKWQLTKAKKGQVAGAGFLAVANLVGVLWLSAELATRAVWGPWLLALKVYAASFFIIPAIRYLQIQNRNAQIEDRNDARLLGARTLKYPNRQLTEKLRSARKLSKRERVRKEDIVFTTAEDVEKQAQDWEGEEFDTRLSKL